MNDHIFPCKDCEQVFTTAKAFVDHIIACAAVENADLLLQNAVMFLRRWSYQGQRRFTHISGVKLTQKLTQQTNDWLKANNLQGNIRIQLGSAEKTLG